jgi:ATP-binding cassette subfamily G (WHITE) protein 2 (SNQ2)
MGSIMVFTMFDKKVNCTDHELAVFDPPSGQTCASYLTDYMMPENEGSRITLLNPDAMSDCRVCQYRVGSDYLATLEINDYYFGWRDSAIVFIFVLSGYALVYLLMKLRTKASKKVE